MSKRKVIISNNGNVPTEFEASTGIVVKIKPVSRFLIDSLIASKPQFTPPTYEVTTAAGNVEVHYHDDKSIETASEEEKKIYTDALLFQKQADTEYNKNFFNLMMLYGADLKLPEDDRWMRKQKKLGIRIPEDEDDLFLHYITTEIFSLEEDATDFVAAVLAASGASKEAAEQLQKSFRLAIQEARDFRNKTISKQPVGSKLAVD